MEGEQFLPCATVAEPSEAKQGVADMLMARIAAALPPAS